MKNLKFYSLLRSVRDAKGRPLWTVGRIAETIYASRATVSDALNNRSRRGRVTRVKLVKFFKREFSGTWRQILAALEWDENGRIVPRGKSHVEQTETLASEQPGNANPKVFLIRFFGAHRPDSLAQSQSTDSR